MSAPEVLGLNLPSLALSGAMLFVRWRLPQVPHYISSPGAAAAVGTLALLTVPDIRMGTLIAGVAALACAAFAVEWQLARPRPEMARAVTSTPSPTAKGLPKMQGEAASPADRNKLAKAVASATRPRPSLTVGQIVTNPVQTPSVAAMAKESSSAAPPTVNQVMITPEAQKNLTIGFFEMRAELAKVWLTRSDDSYVFRPIMDALNRAGVDFVTDSQNPSTPSQNGVVICVPDPAHP